MIIVRIPVRAEFFFFFHSCRFQTGSSLHPVPYAIGTEDIMQREAGKLLKFNVEYQNSRSFDFSPTYSTMKCCRKIVRTSDLKSSAFFLCNVMQYSPFKINRVQQETRVKQVSRNLKFSSCWFLAWLILRPWRCRRHVQKRRLTFKALHVVISRNREPFITTSEITSNHRISDFFSTSSIHNIFHVS
jgi:hypothetical protein